MHQAATPPTAPAPAPRRFDAGKVRVSGRDIARLMLCGKMYGVPYDLLAAYLDVQPDWLRAIAARWRAAGYAETPHRDRHHPRQHFFRRRPASTRSDSDCATGTTLAS